MQVEGHVKLLGVVLAADAVEDVHEADAAGENVLAVAVELGGAHIGELEAVVPPHEGGRHLTHRFVQVGGLVEIARERGEVGILHHEGGVILGDADDVVAVLGLQGLVVDDTRRQQTALGVGGQGRKSAVGGLDLHGGGAKQAVRGIGGVGNALQPLRHMGAGVGLDPALGDVRIGEGNAVEVNGVSRRRADCRAFLGTDVEGNVPQPVAVKAELALLGQNGQ